MRSRVENLKSSSSKKIHAEKYCTEDKGYQPKEICHKIHRQFCAFMFFWRGITIFFIIFFLIYNTLILDISFENVVNSLNSNSSPITFLINWGGMGLSKLLCHGLIISFLGTSLEILVFHSFDPKTRIYISTYNRRSWQIHRDMWVLLELSLFYN